MPPHDNQRERAAHVNIVETGSPHDDPRAPMEGLRHASLAAE